MFIEIVPSVSGMVAPVNDPFVNVAVPSVSVSDSTNRAKVRDPFERDATLSLMVKLFNIPARARSYRVVAPMDDRIVVLVLVLVVTIGSMILTSMSGVVMLVEASSVSVSILDGFRESEFWLDLYTAYAPRPIPAHVIKKQTIKNVQMALSFLGIIFL